MTARIYITGTTGIERPASRRTIFADGAADETFRDGIDLELSHWVPNRTPAAFKADTSTEICMSFAASGDRNVDLVVNNHADVDGVLSVFTLVNPDMALKHRGTIVSAAGMGDFSWWGDEPAQVLFQSLTARIDGLAAAGAEEQTIYEQCMAHVAGIVQRGFADPELEPTLAPLKRSVEWIERKAIQRQEYHKRFVHYAVPSDVCGHRIDAALRVPAFNAQISDEVLFWPQARAKWDRDKIQLVSFATSQGWYYDLWYPSYVWADTPCSWRPPGLTFSRGSHGYRLSYPPLDDAAQEFQRHETNEAIWHVEPDLSFTATPARGYPVVLCPMTAGRPAPSSLEPGLVARRLAAAFDATTTRT